MEVGKGAFGSSGASSSDIATLQQQVAALQAASGSASTGVTPTEGQTINAPPSDKVINILDLTPATDLAALTINLPAEAQSKVGQRYFVRSSRQIDSVTFQCSGGTVDNWLVMMSSGDCVDFTKSKANTWSRSV